MNQFTKIIAVLLILVLISGCVYQDIVQDKYQVITNKDKDFGKDLGYVALSIVCYANAPNISMSYTSSELDIKALLFYQQTNSSLFAECDYIPHYYLLKLPVGKYKIYGFDIGRELHTNGNTFITSSFDVFPHKVVYIGRVKFETSTFREKSWRGFSGEGVMSRYEIVDESKNDILWFINEYKNIPKNYYIKKLAASDNT